MFSLKDFCEPGDEYVDFATGERTVIEDEADGRYWIHDTVVDDQPDVGMPFGDATVGIVDEHEGGVILYCHESNAPMLLNALRVAEEY
jgi:hypothetical protein